MAYESKIAVLKGATMINLKHKTICLFATWLVLTAVTPVFATSFFFSTGNPDGLMASASRPPTPGLFEIESADDFVLTSPTLINSLTFTGLLTGGATLLNISQVVAEIYRVFPNDSDVGRTSGSPTFSTDRVPTRVNSPSDVAFETRDSAVTGDLTFTPGIIQPVFTASNSIQTGAFTPNRIKQLWATGPSLGLRFSST